MNIYADLEIAPRHWQVGHGATLLRATAPKVTHGLKTHGTAQYSTLSCQSTFCSFPSFIPSIPSTLFGFHFGPMDFAKCTEHLVLRVSLGATPKEGFFDLLGEQPP